MYLLAVLLAPSEDFLHVPPALHDELAECIVLEMALRLGSVHGHCGSTLFFAQCSQGSQPKPGHGGQIALNVKKARGTKTGNASSMGWFNLNVSWMPVLDFFSAILQDGFLCASPGPCCWGLRIGRHLKQYPPTLTFDLSPTKPV